MQNINKKWMWICIIFITIFAWYKLVNQTLLGEGYYYFDSGQDFIGQNGKITSTAGPDTFAKILFDVLPPLFHDNIAAYLTFQVIVMILVNLSFFELLLYITKEKWIALTSTLIFSTSYIGLFEMLGTGNYQRFAQRIPNLIASFASFYFLLRFIEFKKTKDLIWSYLLFTVVTFLSHFSTFLLPLFVIYPLIWALFSKDKRKLLVKVLPIGVIYAVINFAIISRDHLEPQTNILKFILEKKDLWEKIVLQFTSLNIPPAAIDAISAIAHPYKNLLIIITIPIIAIYIFGYFAVKKAYPKLRIFYLTSLILIPILLFLNLYLGKVDPEFDISGFNYYFLPKHFINELIITSDIKGDRYYLVPMFFVAFIWASLIFTFIKNKGKIVKVIAGGLVLVYLIHNVSLTWSNFNSLAPVADETKSYLYYVKSIKSDFKKNTTLVVPEYFMWPSSMIRELYGSPDMKFLSQGQNWKPDVDQKYKDQVIILNYDPKTKGFTRTSYK